MERGHPVRLRALHAQPHRDFVQRLFTLRAQADRMSALRHQLLMTTSFHAMQNRTTIQSRKV